MGFWTGVAMFGLAAFGIKKIKDNIEENDRIQAENNRRKNTPCYFNNGISIEEFYDIVRRGGKGIRRITNLSADGPMVYGTVRSQSGISEWYFKIDFNDYGKVTGNYWISSDNDDSDIPKIVADRISEQIENALY